MLKNEEKLLLARIKIKNPSEFKGLEDIAEAKNIHVTQKHSQYIKNAIRFIEKKRVSIVDYFSEGYPSRLRNIDYPPLILFIRGKWKETELPVAVVGTRYPSGYGYRVAEYLIPNLIKAGFDIISGLAKGIDTLSHKLTLKHTGYTVAVLGNGIDVIYPAENRELYEEISVSGCIISEFPIGTKPSKFNFPYRNRIIAGLSRAVIVIEADSKSGSLITARLGAEQSKPVFAVPGEIFSRRSSGTNKLISEGAFPLCSVEDVLSYFYIELKEEVKMTKNSQSYEELNESEIAVLKALGGGKDFDTLVQKLGIPTPKLSEILFDLEIKGVIKNAGGNRYERV